MYMFSYNILINGLIVWFCFALAELLFVIIFGREMCNDISLLPRFEEPVREQMSYCLVTGF